MKAIKTLLAASLAAVLALTMVACAPANTPTSNTELPVLNIGITEYPPLNYTENGKLVGFETEFAEQVCAQLGYKPNFVTIEWISKELELAAKNIDVIWNGMQWTEERAQNMLLSEKYLSNGGVLVVKKGLTDPKEVFKVVAVEKGSQAEKRVDTDKYFKDSEKVKVDKMTKGFLEVQSGNVTSTYCDYIVARGSLANDFADLEIWTGDKNFSVFGDKLALGFRKDDTELANKINGVIVEMTNDGRLKTIADKYNLGDLL